MGGFLSAPGPLELLVILVIALIVLGPKKLPEAARSVGRGMRELRESLQGATEPDPYEDYEPEEEREIEAAGTPAPSSGDFGHTMVYSPSREARRLEPADDRRQALLVGGGRRNVLSGSRVVLGRSADRARQRTGNTTTESRAPA